MGMEVGKRLRIKVKRLASISADQPLRLFILQLRFCRLASPRSAISFVAATILLLLSGRSGFFYGRPPWTT